MEPTIYHVNDMIMMPPEPPVGTVLESHSAARKFRIHHDEEGWRLGGTAARTRRHVQWRVVVELWLPARVVKLPA